MLKAGSVIGRNIRYSKVHATDSDGDLTVSFPSGLFTVAPVVAVNVVGDDTTHFVVQLASDPTTTAAVIKVRGLNGAAAPGVHNVHVMAADT